MTKRTLHTNADLPLRPPYEHEQSEVIGAVVPGAKVTNEHYKPEIPSGFFFTIETPARGKTPKRVDLTVEEAFEAVRSGAADFDGPDGREKALQDLSRLSERANLGKRQDPYLAVINLSWRLACKRAVDYGREKYGWDEESYVLDACEKFVTAAELAEILGVSERHVQRQHYPSVLIGRSRRFPVFLILNQLARNAA
jgi:hypothetical protein